MSVHFVNVLFMIQSTRKECERSLVMERCFCIYILAFEYHSSVAPVWLSFHMYWTNLDQMSCRSVIFLGATSM